MSKENVWIEIEVYFWDTSGVERATRAVKVARGTVRELDDSQH